TADGAPAAPMNLPGSNYPGNPALSPEVRQRVESTYRQSLELAERGNRQEASLGCDFVLQLDPDYTPAQDLLARLDSGKPISAAPPAEGGREDVEALFAEAGFDDLPELSEPGAQQPSGAATGAPPAAAADDLADRLAALVAARRLSEAADLVRSSGDRISTDPRLSELARTVAAQHEAAPYVERFVAAARKAREEGDEETVRANLDKARALDPGHPALAALAEAGSVPGAPEPAAGGGTDLDDDPFAAADVAVPPPTDEPLGDLGGNEEQGRIDDLLGEGQAAFDRGDHQGAIDAWSRIFLIDIDHREAARRIEEARRLKAEQERRIEEVFHEAEQALAGGDQATARQGYERVLEAQPGHDAARKRLEGLDGDGLAAAIGEAASAVAVGAGAAGAAGTSSTPEPPSADGPLREDILVPPEPGQMPRPTAEEEEPSRSLAATREGRAGRRFLLIGTLVFVVVVAAAWLLWENRRSIFPNAEEAASGPVVEEDAIARATALHDSGRTAMAINQLRRLPPTAPEYAEAQALISRWQAESTSPPPPPADGETPVDPAVARHRELVDAAGAALADGNYLSAVAALEQAAEIAALEGEAAELRQAIDRRLAPVARLVELVRQGDQERALPDLWRRLEVEPDDPVVRHLIIEAYYRMGVRDLQRGDAAAAATHLAEATALDPDDPLLSRHQRFAEAYAQRDKDLLYRIYVKYLPPR
ncbi:MAG TPA: hypothetical protein VM617_01740, partial [Thermoanaerobaculia bacterium]|nr:hypothetical protein [Thermoanaerobaculia bacterium]